MRPAHLVYHPLLYRPCNSLYSQLMCSDNPDLPKEANKAKCIAVACFVVCAPAA